MMGGLEPLDLVRLRLVPRRLRWRLEHDAVFRSSSFEITFSTDHIESARIGMRR